MTSTLPTQIQTARLILRPYAPGDGAWYVAMGRRNREHLQRYEADNAARSLHSEAEAETLVRELAAAWAAQTYYFLGAFLRDGGPFVAQIYLGPVRPEVPEFEIGFFADVDHQGQGYVTEAVRAALGFVFEHLGAHRVRLECDDTNERSARVARCCGFVQEGHRREDRRHADGSRTGTLYFGLLRREFEALAAQASPEGNARTTGGTRGGP
jgi:RimJ/RimL family protein N-acetyltransferase